MAALAVLDLNQPNIAIEFDLPFNECLYFGVSGQQPARPSPIRGNLGKAGRGRTVEFGIAIKVGHSDEDAAGVLIAPADDECRGSRGVAGAHVGLDPKVRFQAQNRHAGTTDSDWVSRSSSTPAELDLTGTGLGRKGCDQFSGDTTRVTKVVVDLESSYRTFGCATKGPVDSARLIIKLL